MVAGIEYGHGVAAEVGNVGARLCGRDRHPIGRLPTLTVAITARSAVRMTDTVLAA